MLVTRRVHVCFGNVTRVLHSASGISRPRNPFLEPENAFRVREIRF